MSKQIFSKIAKIGEEVRTIKVDLAKVNLDSALIFLENGIKYSTQNTKYSKTASDALTFGVEQADKQVKANDSILNQNGDFLKRIQSTIQDTESQAKELGVNPTAVPKYNEVVKLFSEFKQADKNLQDAHLKLKSIK
jgi:radical SAM superfamily enzyme with C-terminal helix-hairpin-helix motif